MHALSVRASAITSISSLPSRSTFWTYRVISSPLGSLLLLPPQLVLKANGFETEVPVLYTIHRVRQFPKVCCCRRRRRRPFKIGNAAAAAVVFVCAEDDR